MEIFGKFLSIRVTVVGRAMALIAVNLFFKVYLPFVFFWPVDKILIAFLERFFSWGNAALGMTYNIFKIDSIVTEELKDYLSAYKMAEELDRRGSATTEEMNAVANNVMQKASALVSSRRPGKLLNV